MQKESQSEAIENWQKILSKYSTVWIWSIIIGLNSTMFVSYFNYRPSNFGVVSTMLLSIDCCSLAFSMMSWIKLYQILNSVILPNILKKNIPNHNPNETIHENIDLNYNKYFAVREHSSYQHFLFSRAFFYLIIGLGFKFISLIIEGAFNSLTK